MNPTTIKACALLSSLALIASVSPAWSQADEDIVVTGHFGAPDNAQSLSRTVGYSDLDLSSSDGQHQLHHRISLTARYLCDRLGESDTSASVAPTCRDDATSKANAQADNLIAHWSPRGSGWVAGSAWSAPYPTTWVDEYP
jgi:UrcA family protein